MFYYINFESHVILNIVNLYKHVVFLNIIFKHVFVARAPPLVTKTDQTNVSNKNLDGCFLI